MFIAKFFEMSRKQCKDALDIYKKFVSSMENVAKFLAVAEVSHVLTDLNYVKLRPNVLLPILYTQYFICACVIS